MLLALALGLSATMVMGEEVTRTEKKVEQHSMSGNVTETRKVSVTTYQTRLVESYHAIGIPEDIITRLRQIDIDIYNARVRGDMVRVRELIRERERILGPQWVEKTRVYFHEHPFVVYTDAGSWDAWDISVGGGAVGVTSGGRTDINIGHRDVDVRGDRNVDVNHSGSTSVRPSGSSTRTGAATGSSVSGGTRTSTSVGSSETGISGSSSTGSSSEMNSGSSTGSSGTTGDQNIAPSSGTAGDTSGAGSSSSTSGGTNSGTGTTEKSD